MRSSVPLGPVVRVLDGLVHPNVANDRREFARHRAFILTGLTSGVLALSVLPLALALVGPITLPLILVAAWLAAQIPVAMLLSRSGSLAGAHLASALLFAAFIGGVAALTGGTHSFAIVWLAIAPLEAALSGSRKVIAVVALAAATIIVLLGLAPFAAVPQFSFAQGGAPGFGLEGISSVAALAYAGLLALRVDWDQRQGRALLDEGEAKYRLLAENVHDVITLHEPDGSVLFVSPSVEAALGLSRVKMLGRGLFQRVHVADRPAFLKAISDACGFAAPSTIEFRVQRGGGNSERPEYSWLEMNARCVEEKVPGIGGAVVAVLRDISERKIQDAALAEARELAEAASAAKTRFLANVSHELRTPLNAIIGFSDLLRHSPHLMQDQAKSLEYIDLIHDSGRHLLQVVNDILDMSKIETGNFELSVEPFDVGHCVESCRKMMAGAADKAGIALLSDISPSLGEFPADRRACKQIILNLLSNAVKFTHKDGRVLVSARLEREDLVIRVEDSGIGIAESDLKRLGMPFFQVNGGYNRSHEGTGLGLSVVKGLAELHGGKVTFDSRLGKGTAVTIRLPRPAGHTPAAAHAATSAMGAIPARRIA
ncbi:PAS domain S-box protein [Stappia sp. F7233]|uniref:histidine kinase n=1 Tax=Stappia albiluteola TaxID=2758565 RepID=A0A839AKS5_9HYPH|nr:PAS domain-containing sensor histidine kinase [Stappia albiluteola]MBA5779049.1 PAS domain S-box protein [Stappia albiluteola]